MMLRYSFKNSPVLFVWAQISMQNSEHNSEI